MDGVASVLSDLSLLIYTYVRNEAVLSSQIEGTQSSLSDLLLFENDEIPGVPVEDVQEVSNYLAAMNYGLERLRSGFPLSNRLIREIHDILLSMGGGSDKHQGNTAGAKTGSVEAGQETLSLSHRHLKWFSTAWVSDWQTDPTASQLTPNPATCACPEGYY